MYFRSYEVISRYECAIIIIYYMAADVLNAA